MQHWNTVALRSALFEVNYYKLLRERSNYKLFKKLKTFLGKTLDRAKGSGILAVYYVVLRTQNTESRTVTFTRGSYHSYNSTTDNESDHG